MNVLKLGRKALTVSTVFSTMLWSVGVSAFLPVAAQAQTCPAFQPGDMIKVTGRPAIYSVDAAGRVLYFPSGDEFKSWNTGETYGGYTSVSQACFDSLPVPTSAPLGVNFRPGSYVVKRPSSDQLYVVVPGNMLATITVDAAKALYGANYKVMTVADVFWPNYGNTRGAAVTEAKAHPGMLVSNGGKTYVVDSSNTLREVTASGFTANRFKTAFVRPLASVAGYNMGTQVTAFEAGLGDRTQSGVAGGQTPVTGGALTVSLASDNPAANILASNTAFNPVLKVNLTAGSQAVNVTGLTLRKSGFAANNTVSGVEVIDSQGVRHGNIATSITSENDVTVLFTGSPIVVAAGTTQTVTVRVNLSSNATAGTLQFSLVGPSSVQANGTVGGSFPVTGNVFTLQSGVNAVATVTVELQSVSGANGTQLNVDAANQQEITKFRISETSSRENVRFSKLAIYNNGTAADSDVQDVQLVSQEGTVLATAQQVGKVVTFNLVTPYVIDKGTSDDFTVRAKVVGGAGRTIQFTIFNNYDVVVAGQTTGAGILANATGVDTTFPVGDHSATFNKVTVGSGTLSFNKDTTSPSAAVTPASTGVVLAKYFVKPTGEDMELRQIALAVVSSSQVLSGSITVKVNGSAVYSASPSDISASSTALTTVTLSSFPTLTAGTNSFITVEASNIVSGAANGATMSAHLDLVQVRRLLTNDIIDPTVNAVSGNTIAVQAGALRATNLATPVAASLVAGTSGVELAKVELNAGAVSSGEDVRVSRIVISDVVASSGVLSDIGNLVLYDAAGNAIATSASTAVNAASNTFSFVNPIIVPKSGAVTLTLKGDVITGTQGTHTFRVASSSDVTAVGQSTGNTITPGTVVGNGQIMTIASSGTLSISLVTGANAAPSVDQTVVVGTTNNSVFAVRLSAQKEPIKVSSLTLTATGTIGAVSDLTNVKLVTDNGTAVGAPIAQGVSTTAGVTFTWTAADALVTVNPGTPVTLYVKADVAGQGVAKLGDSFRFTIASSTTDVVAKGASSNVAAVASGTAAVTALSYVTPFNVSVAAEYPTAPVTTLVAGARLATVKITNNGSAPITLTDVKFTDSGAHGTNNWTHALRYSSENSSDFAANTAASTSSTDYTGLSITIAGGAYRYVSVYLASGTVASGDSAQFSIAAAGDVNYSVTETDLGYDINVDGDVSTDTATGLVAEGKPTLSAVSKP